MSTSAPTGGPENFTFHIAPERRIALICVQGPFTTFLLAEAMTVVYRSPVWRPGFDILWDLREITEWAIDWDDIVAFVELDQELESLSGNGRDVVLVGNQLHLMNIEAYAMLSRDNPRTVVPTSALGKAAEEIGWTTPELSDELDRVRRGP